MTHWLVWYRDDGKWIVTFYKLPMQFGPLKYSRPKDWLANAEKHMRGTPKVTLYHLTEEKARQMLWC